MGGLKQQQTKGASPVSLFNQTSAWSSTSHHIQASPLNLLYRSSQTKNRYARLSLFTCHTSETPARVALVLHCWFAGELLSVPSSS
eukprot:m.55204 g.55204  ORF g.55204 m.55204 type:complete len:86 (-) comp12516_c0_seq1:349-606(-)